MTYFLKHQAIFDFLFLLLIFENVEQLYYPDFGFLARTDWSIIPNGSPCAVAAKVECTFNRRRYLLSRYPTFLTAL